MVKIGEKIPPLFKRSGSSNAQQYFTEFRVPVNRWHVRKGRLSNFSALLERETCGMISPSQTSSRAVEERKGKEAMLEDTNHTGPIGFSINSS